MPTAKVTPHSLDPQLSQPSFKNASEQDTKEDIIIEKHLNDEKPLIQQQKSKLDGKLPISVFIIILISSLLVLSCLLIWVSSNALSRQAIEELSSEVIDISGEKLTLYLDSLLDPLGRLSRVVASDYNNGIANLSNYRKYLVSYHLAYLSSYATVSKIFSIHNNLVWVLFWLSIIKIHVQHNRNRSKCIPCLFLSTSRIYRNHS